MSLLPAPNRASPPEPLEPLGREGTAEARRVSLLPLGIALATFAAFLPVLWAEFVDWDDYYNFSLNQNYRGLGWTQLRWMLTTTLLGHYIPLTWLTLGVDHALWGMNATGYHLTNLVLHSANSVLLYFVALRLLRRAIAGPEAALRAGATAAALFFAIHPLRVETVAWVTERRGVLSAFFFLLTVLSYLAACAANGGRRRRLLAVSVAAYLCAAASKATVMTLPAALLLLDVYPLRRLQGLDPRLPSNRPVWIEKAPYVAIAILAAAMSYYAHASVSAIQAMGWSERVAAGAYSLWFHVVKTLLPLGLSPLYELPAHLDLRAPDVMASLVGVIGVSATTVALRRVWPAGLAAWAYHVIALAPVSGFIHTGVQLTADRYSYLVGLGWAVLLGGGVVTLLAAGSTRALRLGVVVGAVWLLTLGAVTWKQVQVWQRTETLWRHALSVTPDCSICHVNFGLWLMSQGDAPAALAHFERAAAVRPDRSMVYARQGSALENLGRLPEAAERYRRELARDPDSVSVRNALAAVLIRLGRPGEALDELQPLLLRAPHDSWTHTNTGFALHALGRREEAVEHFRRAIALRPNASVARFGLVQLYLSLGQVELAREQYEVVRTLNPGLANQLRPAFEMNVRGASPPSRTSPRD